MILIGRLIVVSRVAPEAATLINKTVCGLASHGVLVSVVGDSSRVARDQHQPASSRAIATLAATAGLLADAPGEELTRLANYLDDAAKTWDEEDWDRATVTAAEVLETEPLPGDSGPATPSGSRIRLIG